jgi:uncharacterized protein YlbG (UPF0298 family)
MSFKRAISEQFMQDLKEGILSPILARVKEDDTLMLALRGDYINIYYRGGSLLKIESNRDSYMATFDEDYNKKGQVLDIVFPYKIIEKEDSIKLVDAVLKLKYVMDLFFGANNRLEREFQQLVVRENNYSSISNETEYFIIDIETSTELEKNNAKFDMLAVRWLKNDRAKSDSLTPVIIEMKYGKDSINGSSGIEKHLEDAKEFVFNNKEFLCQGLEKQLDQLRKLGLIKYTNSETKKLTINCSDKVEIVFLLANYNPNSDLLLKSLENIKDEASERYDLKFFRASFAGYGLRHSSMLTLDAFKAEVDALYKAEKKRQTNNYSKNP